MADKNSKTRRLLVIDDEANMRHMLSTVLKKAGYRVDGAADGAEGLQMIDQVQYDFILCDIKMPNMGGMDFLKRQHRYHDVGLRHD
jgi:two-component system response regulator AtoC